MGCAGSKKNNTPDDGAANNGAAGPTANSATGGVQLQQAKRQGFARHQFIASNKGKIDEVYSMETKAIGKGTYGSVSIARNRATNAQRAVKSMSKKTMGAQSHRLLAEIGIMKALDHPSIIKLYETFEDARSIYLVMELCTGGELFDRIVDSETGFTEKVAAKLMKQILGGLKYMHTQEVAHRDLKPENFLMLNDKSVADDAQALKIIDFGLSKQYTQGVPMSTKACTPYYVAPEVLAGSYNQLCDVWSAGVIMYVLLSGSPPFWGDTDKEVLRRVTIGAFDFDMPSWQLVSSDAKDLIRQMFVKNASKRYSAEQCLRHPWVERMAPNATDAVLSNAAFNSLKRFRSQNRLKKAALTVIAQELSDDAIKQLKDMFISLDADNDGTLTVEEIRCGMSNCGIPLPSDLEQLMQSIDSDGSGQIDYSEFLAATLDRKQYIQEDLCWAAFRVFDLDNDGKLTKEELHSVLNGGRGADIAGALGMEKDEIAKIIESADADGDGELDFDEFMTMMRGD